MLHLDKDCGRAPGLASTSELLVIIEIFEGFFQVFKIRKKKGKNIQRTDFF
jgi:hypothetical protein